jgi:hypothetical protein
MFRFLFIFLAVTYFFIHSSFAGQAMYYGTHQQFLSTRAVGMGNAGVAVANDENAMFYNPAGLRQLSEGHANYFIKAGGNPDVLKFADDINKAGKDSTAIAAAIEKNYGKNYSLRAPSLGFLWAHPTWSFAFIPADVSIDTSLHEAVGPAINLYVIQDTTVAFSKAWNIHNFEPGRLDVGVTAKGIYRAQLDKIVDIASIQNKKVLEASDSNEGLAVDFDIGALWKAPSMDGFWGYVSPRVGVVVRNVLDYGYISNLGLYAKDKQGDPEKLHRVVDVGSAFKLPHWWVFDSEFAFDVRDMLHPNWTFNKGVHAGFEFKWGRDSWWNGGWRVGINQMYWTAGFSGRISFFKLDLASYGREVGTSSQKVEDRVYMLTTSFDF